MDYVEKSGLHLFSTRIVQDINGLRDHKILGIKAERQAIVDRKVQGAVRKMRKDIPTVEWASIAGDE